MAITEDSSNGPDSRTVSMTNSDDNSDVYSNASTISDLRSTEQREYPVVYDVCPSVLGQAVLNGDAEYTYLSGGSSAVMNSDTKMELDGEHKGVSVELPTRVSTDSYRAPTFGTQNPFAAQHSITVGEISEFMMGVGIKDVAIHDSAVMCSIPSKVTESFVPANINANPPTEVCMLFTNRDVRANTDATGNPTFDITEYCRELLLSITGVTEDSNVFRNITPRLKSVLKMDQFFFDNGLSHDDLVGTQAYYDFLQWYVSDRPWMDVGVPQKNGVGREYQLLKNDGRVIV